MRAFLNLKDIADELGKKVSTLRTYRNQGKLTLPLVKVDGMLGCRREVFEKWLEGGRIA